MLRLLAATLPLVLGLPLTLLLAVLLTRSPAPLGLAGFVLRHAQEDRQSTPSDTGQHAQGASPRGSTTNSLRQEVELVPVHTVL